jgi:acyl carrier protein
MTEANDVNLRRKIKELIVSCARLKVPPSSLPDDQPLFQEPGGLGLDSIDVLELVVALEKDFGVAIQDREVGRRVLRSVSTIVDFVKKA